MIRGAIKGIEMASCRTSDSRNRKSQAIGGLVPVCLGLLPFLLLTGCHSHSEPKATHTQAGPNSEIIALPHGTIAAMPGSQEYELGKFMTSNDPAPRTFRFGTNQFAPWSDQVSPRTQGTLAVITLILRDYPTAKIKLTGYTDNVGDVQRNLDLSIRRVGTLKRLLVEGGIAGSRITTEGFGMADPIASNDTDEGRAQNRRIELTILSK
jgi:outer membrane protein OmpA-like peptidoglycan-associated protein